MDDIIEPTIDYDFSKLYLGPPSNLAGGAYFTRVMHNTNKPLYIQTPKSLTKQGFIKGGKKVYTDLMFDNNDNVFINWIENLETRFQELIFNKSQQWFEGKLEKDDIESAFTSPFKIFKSGKHYLLRVNVKPNIKIYNENDQHVAIDDVTCDKTIISILEIQGIKFTSRNFQIEFELKQSMIVSPDPFLDECFIKKPIKKLSGSDNPGNIDHYDTNASTVNACKIDTLNIDSFIKDSASDISNNTNEIPLEKANYSTHNSINNKKSDNTDLEQINLDVSLNEELLRDEEYDENINDNVITSDNNDKNDNILLDIEELTFDKEKELEDPNMLKEFDVTSTLENSLETITLKKPNQVYYEIYKKAREKAKDAKKIAINAFLEMKNIKKTYMLDVLDESDSDFDEFASQTSDSDSESLEEDN